MIAFHKYEILELIGEGGFGTVFKAYDPLLKRHVAIKTCKLKHPDVRARFTQEAEIAASLKHPHIVTIYDFGEVDGELYLVQEFLTGRDLDELIQAQAPMDLPTRLGYLSQLADGLAFAHSRGVVHRDVKPSNVRVEQDGTVRIMDFGIAKLLEAEQSLTQTGLIVGTVGYLAPEQLRGERVDHRADIFGYGALGYLLICNRPPFEGENTAAVAYQIVHEDPPPMEQFAPDCPAELAAVIGRCLRRNVDERFSTLTEAKSELDAIRIELMARRSGVASVATIEAGAPHPGPPWFEPWRRIAAAALFVVALIATVSIATWSTQDPFPVRERPTAPALADDPGGEEAPETSGPASSLPREADHRLRAGDRSESGSAPALLAGGAAASPQGPSADDGKPAQAGAAESPPPADDVDQRLVLVLLRGDGDALTSAESALLGALLDNGLQVVGRGQIDQTKATLATAGEGRSGQVREITELGRSYGAGTVIVGEIRAEATPSVGNFYTGSAVLSVRTYDAAAGSLIGASLFQIGSGQTPGKLGLTEQGARSEAAAEVGRQAALATARRLSI